MFNFQSITMIQFQITMKVNSKSKWRFIPMSQNFFSGDMDQAVCRGIDEITDYTLVVK